MQMRRLAIMLFCLLPMAALLYGCGSSSKSGGSINSVATVGDTACVQCHSTAKDPLTGEGLIDQYNKSAHASSTLLNGAGCEACHGGGAQHNGVGPIAYPIPDATRCATCHTGTNSTVFQTALTQEGAEENPAALSNHANGGYEGVVTSEKCYRCHSGEGAVLSNVAGYTGDKNIIDNTAYMLTQDRDFSKFGGINCNTCHQHGGALRAANTRDLAGNVVTWDPNGNRKIDQFDLCTSCHVYQNPDGTLVASGTAASGTKPATAPFYHNTSWNRMIVTTHWDNPATTGTQASATADVTNTPVEGYVIRKTGVNPCFDCHGHEAKANTQTASGTKPSTIYTDWAKSAHAGHLLEQKIAAATGSGTTQVDNVMNAKTDDTTGIAWTHYNWDNSTGIARGAGDQDRKTCQRCHTATGAANYLSSPSTYDAANNDFSHLSGWVKYNSRSNPTYTTQTSPQNELLYCWGCHSNSAKGTLRTPGAITANYTGNPYTYPDLAGSNVCMSCHVGQETGGSIKANTDADGTLNFINAHYLAAGGTLFGTTGYEYADKSYANPSYFKHDTIGSSAAAGTGSNGPCAGCHMTTPNSHKFTNVTKTAGVITALTSTACITCHDGSHGTALQAGSADAATFLATEEHHYHAALDALAAALASKGIHFYAAYPYFFNGAGGTGGSYTTWAAPYGVAKWKDTMGAAFNYNLLHHDPGGYAHNRMYAKRLIFDAIDFIDNGVLNGTISVTGDAATYLGTTRP